MKPFSAFVLAFAFLLAPLAARQASAQTLPAVAKMNAYVGCINRLSERAYDSRKRYFSWAGRNGPTGRERIIYGTYTISGAADCQKNVEKANAMEPHDAALEAAATAYADAVTKLDPLLKEADDYYTQENYKDDRMAKGRALHPRLVAAWNAFALADQTLRREVEAVNDRRAIAELAEIEKSEGKKTRYYVHALMIEAKRVIGTQERDKPDLAALTQALAAYEEAVKGAEQASGNGGPKLGSFFMGNAKAFLVTGKQLMRRIRDHVPYSSGDRMMLANHLSGWMVEGSPPRLLRDYNQLVEAYNRGPGI
ncbi:MAG TPA: YiiG family protein [Pseudolabrys sp.]|nr:YiiG family protein [Pseudolabrys sp.]